MDRNPIKKYTILLMLDALRGKNKKLTFTGTKAEARNFAQWYVMEHHLAPQAVYLQEAK